MSEFEFLKPDHVLEVRKPIERKKLGTLTKTIDGGKIFAFDKETGEIKEVTYRDSLIVGEPPKIDLEKGKIYVEALNLKNAKKRILKKKTLFET